MTESPIIQCGDCEWAGSPIEFIRHWDLNRTHSPANATEVQ